MSEKSEALQLADALDECKYVDVYRCKQAAAKLRFLHEKCEALTADTIEEMGRIVEIRRLTAQRDALLEALRTLLSYANVLEMRLVDADGEHRAMQQARAAIKMAEEGK